jgi:uncharacterized protein (DUF2141 family)
MLRYLYFSFLTIFLLSFITRCASISAPTGGPKDTIPPSLINSIPPNKSINYHDNTIYLEFDEWIKADKLKDQLIITPVITSKYENSIKKNLFKLTFDEPFADSTTYTLNFREGIQDITESNPILTNKFTFSTGTFIDSLTVYGLTTNLLNTDTVENAIVGLYRVDDTVNVFNGSPYYFSQTDDKGKYSIENIKNGKYLAIAFLDNNKNLKLDFKSEAYAFKKDTLTLDSIPVELNFKLSKLDITPFRQITALPSGKYYEINFNKYITDFNLIPLDTTTKPLYANLAKQNKSIRFYNPSNLIDSIAITYTAIDSINTSISDTVYVKFTESKRKTDDFSFIVTPKQGAFITTDFDAKITFNKPILNYILDSLYFEYDSKIIKKIDYSIFLWNSHKDKLNFSLTIDKAKIDTFISNQRKTTDASDSLPVLKPTQQQQVKKDKVIPKKNLGFRLYIGKGTFISADYDSSVSSGYNYKFIKPEEVGTQEIITTSEYQSFTIQLLTEKFEIYEEISGQKLHTFQNVPPGKYRIRILIDSNNDGHWSPGNMLNNEEPEPVYIYPETLIIRADWRTKLELSF